MAVIKKLPGAICDVAPRRPEGGPPQRVVIKGGADQQAAGLRHLQCRRSVAVDVEVEILVLQLLILAVGADGVDGSADLVSQRLVTLTHGNTGTMAVVLLLGEVRADQGEVFAGVGLEEAFVDIDYVRSEERRVGEEGRS